MRAVHGLNGLSGSVAGSGPARGPEGTCPRPPDCPPSTTPGTWGYSQYANNGHPNGNAAGQGDYDYPPNNLGFLFASQAQGLQTFSTSTAPANTVLSEMPVSIFQGIAAVAFPSKRLGVAVGSSATFHGSAAAGQFTAMTILVTVDGGLTWMRASGLPRLNQLNAPVNTNAWGTPQTAPPWPVRVSASPSRAPPPLSIHPLAEPSRPCPGAPSTLDSVP